MVVAVQDICFDPYHYDFLASQMPQARDNDSSNDLPLNLDPSLWVSGFPNANAFASIGPLNLTLPANSTQSVNDLHQVDHQAWDSVQLSTPDKIHYYWIPGTKVVGFIDFDDSTCRGGFGGPTSCDGGACHGTGVTSVSVGNIYGTCPECVLVFLNGYGHDEWVQQQGWIDVHSISAGVSTGECVPVTGPCVADSIYSNDVSGGKAATARGQVAFFAAGNGMMNDFSVPNTALASSLTGPDWIVSVGAINIDGSSFTGSGLPAKIASLGTQYPSSVGASTVTGSGHFSGTSNATPVVAGLYARALHFLRTLMAGPSRMQSGGIVSSGAIHCGQANPTCPVANGTLSAQQLVRALYAAASPGTGRFFVGDINTGVPGNDQEGEATLAYTGHGIYYGRFFGDAILDAETKSIVDAVVGNSEPKPTPDMAEWMLHDSYCRQTLWGTWFDGDWNPASPSPLPDPTRPLQTLLYDDCAETIGLL